jgi:hypothetical protein
MLLSRTAFQHFPSKLHPSTKQKRTGNCPSFEEICLINTSTLAAKKSKCTECSQKKRGWLWNGNGGQTDGTH